MKQRNKQQHCATHVILLLEDIIGNIEAYTNNTY